MAPSRSRSSPPAPHVSESVIFAGEPFTVADRIGLMPLMRFAKVAQSGVDSDDMAGLAAMYDLLEQCIAPEEWARFQKSADDSRADGEQLMAVVTEVMQRIADRPTSRPSDSSAGPPPTSPKSTDGSYLRVIGRYEGRPDIQQIIVQAQEAS